MIDVGPIFLALENAKWLDYLALENVPFTYIYILRVSNEGKNLSNLFQNQTGKMQKGVKLGWEDG